MQEQFFKDLKVIELASVLAGPAVGMFFAELGAQVIKIENKKTGGDVTRRWKLPSENKDAKQSAYYSSVNWNKEAQLLDLSEENDKQAVYDLIKEADIVISNFKLASAQKMGMDYDVLKALNPSIIYAQLTAYGEHDERPAFDVVLQAEAGFLFMNGEPGGNPVKMPVALIDLLAAHQLKEGVLLALLHRYKTGKGSYVTASLFDAAIASLANQATNWLMAGHIPQRMGCMHPNIAPYGDIFQTKDNKSIILAVGTERQFQQLCQVLGAEQLTKEERFAVNIERVKNRVVLAKKLTPYIVEHNRDDLLNRLAKANIPAGGIRNMQEVFELPRANQLILEEKLADGTQSKRVKTVAFQIKS